ncbi:MAG TPA: histidine phosphatase family protein [Candidatus Polarisedimenticolaceae bacterium]|nr:histidine phosphatase family protein [Candidatus Polarisedimenticolaceae bacterium]
MKSILLMRHAKSETGAPDQSDFDRALAPRGRHDAERMGKAIAKLDAVPDAVVSSTAVRAKETAEIASQAMRWKGALKTVSRLYNADGDAWLQTLRELPASASSAIVVAHSPGIEEAAGLLCGAPSRAFDVPTGAVLLFAAEIDRWNELRPGDAVLEGFLRPKAVAAL